MRKLLIAALVLVAGCSRSVEDVRNEPVRISVTVAAPWPEVGQCLANAFSGGYEAIYRPVTKEDRATLVLSAVSDLSRMTIAIFDIRKSGDGTLIEWRRGKIFADVGGLDRRTRETIDRCSNQ